MRRTYWRSGEHSAICDICGMKFKASKLRLRWDGLMVCRDDFEVRHPQELIRSIPDQNKLSWTRPEAVDKGSTPLGFYDPFSFTGEPSLLWHYSRTLSDNFSFTESLIIVKGKVFNESFTLNSSGTITLPAYIDVTYFAADYMTTSQSFS